MKLPLQQLLLAKFRLVKVLEGLGKRSVVRFVSGVVAERAKTAVDSRL